MRKLFTYLAILASFGAPALRSIAAPPDVTVTMRPDSILIGDHVTLRIEVEKDMMQVVEFPEFDSEQKADIRIIRELPIDTLETGGRRQRLAKEYILTSFKAGEYSLSKFPLLYLDKNIADTLMIGEDLLLRVHTFDIDTASTTIYDIKAPEDAPVMIDEFRGYLMGGIIAACVLAALVWVVAGLIARRRKEGPDDKPKLRIPAHTRAIGDLERLHNQKLWQNGKHKLYYTHLTDILREYLDGRYGIGAMEMTTDEIIFSVSGISLNDKNFDALNDILRTADLVKFAKYVPDADYNEKAYYDAYYFIEDTKEVVEEVKDAEDVDIGPEKTPGDE